MEYPGTKFKKPWRIAMFFTFILAFLVITPLVILTTAGYRLDWNSGRFSFRGTGSLSIDIRPTSAVVYLNGIRLLGSMPYRLNALTPENPYTLKITNNGYFDWQKEIEIRANETYYLKDITMLKKNDPVLITTGTIWNATVSPDGETVLYFKLHNISKQLWQYSTLNDSHSLLLELPNTKESTEIISWHNGSQFALLEEKNRSSDWYSIAIRPKKSSPLSETFKKPIGKAVWNTGSNPELYVAASTSLSVYRPESGSVTPAGTLRSPIWYVEGSRIITLEQSTSTHEWVVIDDAFGFKNEIARIPFTDTALGSPDSNWDSVALIGSSILLARPNGNEMKLVTPQKTFTVPATHFLVSRFNNWLLLWNDTEIWTYIAGDEPRLLNRSGEKLQAIIPLDQYNTLALAWKDVTTVLYPYYLISHELLPSVNSLTADPNRRELYFSGKIKDETGLWQLAY